MLQRFFGPGLEELWPGVLARQDLGKRAHCVQRVDLEIDYPVRKIVERETSGKDGLLDTWLLELDKRAKPSYVERTFVWNRRTVIFFHVMVCIDELRKFSA